MSEPSLPELESRRAGLFARLAAVGDFRRGSITENYRRCGKPNCACAEPGHPGHGPRWLWTRTVAGRGTRGRQLAVAEIEKVRAELGPVPGVRGVDRADRPGERGDLRGPAGAAGDRPPCRVRGGAGYIDRNLVVAAPSVARSGRIPELALLPFLVSDVIRPISAHTFVSFSIILPTVPGVG